MQEEKPEILFLGSGPYPLDRRLENDQFKYFSEHYSCNLLTPVNQATKKMTSLKETKVEDNFTLIPFSYYYKNVFIRNFFVFYNLITKALSIFYIKKRKFKVVISGDPLMAGLCALIIAKLTGTKSIIEVNGNFESAFKYGRLGETKVGFIDKVKDKVGKYLIGFTLQQADMVKLVAPGQLKSLFARDDYKKIKTESFPNFVPIQYFLNHNKEDDKYILLLGFPWYLKGVDILIKAFNKISKDFPDYRLKIVGWCPRGREYFENLAKDNSQIDLCEPIPYKDVIPLMTKCSLYVLASRTDASPRVLREAMASKKPIIASNIDGVPDLIKDGFNGLLFEKENIEDLAEKIKLVLSNTELAEKLAQNGYQYVQKNLSEKCYIEHYKGMIDATMGRSI